MGTDRTAGDRSLTYIDTQRIRLEPFSRTACETGEHYALGFVMGKGLRIEAESIDANRPAIAGQAGSGEWFLLPPRCRVATTNDRALPAELAIVRFAAREALPASGDRLPTLRQPRSRERAEAFLASPSAERLSDAAYYRVQAQLHAIMADFAEASTEAGAARTGGEEELLGKVEAIRLQLAEQYDRQLDVDELARQSGLSPSRFYQAFRKHTGFPPHKYVTERRLNASLSLLANEPTSIAEAAHAVGYGDELYFSRLFKKHMGLSPSEYASRASRRVANLCPVFEGDLAALGIAPALSLPRGWFETPEPYIRRVEEAKPDLILTVPVPDDVHRALSAVAPTHAMQWKGWPWKERLRYIAGTLNIPTVAERWLQRFEEKAGSARRQITDRLQGAPFLVVSVHRGWYRVYGLKRKKMADMFYEELGFAAPRAASEIGFLDTESLSDAAALDCDNVVFLVPEEMSDDFDLGLERMWRSERKLSGMDPRKQPICLIVRHKSPIYYSAAFHETLVDQTVSRLHRWLVHEKSI